MKKILTILMLLITTVIGGFSQQIKSELKLIEEDGRYKIEYNGKKFDANEIIVTVKPKLSLFNYKSNLEIVRENKLGFIDVKVPSNRDLEEYAEELKKTKLFDTVEFNAFGEYGTFQPDDPGVSSQWYLSKIKMYDAWELSTGSASVVIGILDSGTDWEHEDIGVGFDSYQNIFLNPGEDAWSDVNDPSTGNGIDDDGNGLIDDWKGWNYVNNSNDSRSSNYHGTVISGIISAKTNNGRGIAGIAGGNNNNGVKLLPYCIGIAVPDGSILDDAIIDAVDIGVKVIQLSLKVLPSSAIDAALQYAVENDVAVVCCSMNEGSSTVTYPASNSNVIAVGATTTNDTRATFSNYGTELDLVAPGVDIYGTTLNNNYTTDSGTSYAAPQVSAVAALLFSINNNLTVQEVKNIIESTAQKVGGYTYTTTYGHPNGTWNEQIGYGLLDAYAALQLVYPYISGSNIVCSTGETFTINNAPTGSTITWSSSSNITLPQDIHVNPIYVSSIGNGDGWLQAEIIIGGITYTLPAKLVIVGSPTPFITTKKISGIDEPTEYEFTAAPYYIGATYNWYVGSTLTYTDYYPNNKFSLYYPCNVTKTVKCKITNTCGTSSFSNSITKTGGCRSLLSLNISPNPASDYIQVTLNKENYNDDQSNSVLSDVTEPESSSRYMVNITDMYGKIVYAAQIGTTMFTIPIYGINNGTYIIMVTNNKTIWQGTLIVNH